MTAADKYTSVHYLVDDVQAAIDFYTTHLNYPQHQSRARFVDVVGGLLRLPLSGPASSGTAPLPTTPPPPGQNRIHLRAAAQPAGTPACRSSRTDGPLHSTGHMRSCPPKCPSSRSSSSPPSYAAPWPSQAVAADHGHESCPHTAQNNSRSPTGRTLMNIALWIIAGLLATGQGKTPR